MLKGLRTVIYVAPDLPAARDWYSRAFAIKPYCELPFYVGFNVGGFELGLILVKAQAQGPGGEIAYWGVDDVADVHRHLLSLGASNHDEPHDVGEGIVVGSVLDPFGNPVGLIHNPHFNPQTVG
jgi:catechol 2,3-dioxygenase-like lactoylglutathione lyase family enzyme